MSDTRTRLRSHDTGRRRASSRSARRFLLAFLVALPVVMLGSDRVAIAGDLAFFEASSSPGVPRVIASPAADVLLDIDYSASSAEGGGVYGLAEVRIRTSGDLALTSSNFSCPLTSCLYAPFPWVGGNEVIVTGGEDLAGETAGSLDVMHLSVSGTAGYVFVYRGEYIDATGAGGTLGQVQTVEPTIIATVPEPDFGLALACGGALMAAASRMRPSRLPTR